MWRLTHAKQTRTWLNTMMPSFCFFFLLMTHTRTHTGPASSSCWASSWHPHTCLRTWLQRTSNGNSTHFVWTAASAFGFSSHSHCAPTHTVARLAWLALRSPPSTALYLVPFVYNLLKRHPACVTLIHRTGAKPAAGTAPATEAQQDIGKWSPGVYSW